MFRSSCSLEVAEEGQTTQQTMLEMEDPMATMRRIWRMAYSSKRPTW